MRAIHYRTGEEVNIFQDPVTEKRAEGKATLKQFQGKDSYYPYVETWLVKFDNESETFLRTIMPPS